MCKCDFTKSFDIYLQNTIIKLLKPWQVCIFVNFCLSKMRRRRSLETALIWEWHCRAKKGNKVLFVWLSRVMSSSGSGEGLWVNCKPGIREMLILPWQQRTENLGLGHCNFGDWWLWSPAECLCVTNDMRDSRSRQRITLIRRRLHTVSTKPDDIQTSIANIQRPRFSEQNVS